MSSAAIKRGLKDVAVSESRICSIDGKKGKLLYNGYNIHNLARNSTYEEVSYLLLYEKLPTKRQLDSFKKKLKITRKLPKHSIKIMKDMCSGMSPMEALRTTVSSLSCGETEASKISLVEHRTNGTNLIAKFPTIISHYYRIRKGLKTINPDPSLSHAGNFLYMMFGEKPDEESEKALDTDLILHAEHGFNASTFAARVAVSTLSDMYSAITSAIGTLKGPLHGGAAQQVMKMLLAVKRPENAKKYVRAKLSKHEKIMGFGHRVYKAPDPRAIELKRMSEILSKKKRNPRWFKISDALEKTVFEEKGLYSNVDFYSASVYHYLGIPPSLYTPIFAMGRISGWVAHSIEQYADNKLIRPRSVYAGPRNLKYIPIRKRK